MLQELLHKRLTNSFIHGTFVKEEPKRSQKEVERKDKILLQGKRGTVSVMDGKQKYGIHIYNQC